MDCLDKVVDKKVRKPRTPKAMNEEITSKMVSEQFDKVYIELKKLEEYIFKPSIVEQPVLEIPLEPVVKKSRVSKKKPLIISVDGV
jgi:hypothetical protein